jgi:hypothetical protein
MFDHISENDLYHACKLLFTPDIRITADFLRRLSVSNVRAAYRNRVMENHPDRAKLLGREPAELENDFKSITVAYQHVSGFVEKKNNVAWNRRNTQAGRSETWMKNRAVHAYIPAAELLFGQYLFYSRLISLDILAGAIYWQRKQRPSYGKIALDRKLMKAKDIHSVIAGRKHGEKFGECALRNGFVSNADHDMILLRQRVLQKPIGEYFILHGFLSAGDIQCLLKELHWHNFMTKKSGKRAV